MEALIGKNTGVFQGELGSSISASLTNEGFFGLVWGIEL